MARVTTPRLAAPFLLLLALIATGCAGEGEVLAPENGASPTVTISTSPIEAPSLAPTPSTTPKPEPSPTPSEVTPRRTNFETCLGVPSDPAACTENLPEPGEG